MRALLRYANFTHVAQGLTQAGYPVSGPTVSRWAQGRNVTPMAVKLVERLILEGIEESPPAWAEGLADKTARKVIEALVDPQVLAALPAAIAALEALPPPPDDSPRVGGGSPDQVARPL
jgi:hypothetical protein